MKYILMLVVCMSFHSRAGIDSLSGVVARTVQKKLTLTEKAFSRLEASSAVLRENNDEAYFLKRIRLQYAPFVAFDIKFFELKVMPLIEFRWTRKNPKGWVNFKRES